MCVCVFHFVICSFSLLFFCTDQKKTNKKLVSIFQREEKKIFFLFFYFRKKKHLIHSHISNTNNRAGIKIGEVYRLKFNNFIHTRKIEH
jgi:hypothetical protein